jgi:hypothetical protein
MSQPGTSTSVSRIQQRSPLLLLVLLGLIGSGAASATTLETPTGLHVTIHSTAEIEADLLTYRDGRVYLDHPTAGEVELDTEHHPWSGLTPVTSEPVAEALRDVQGFVTDLNVDVFLLPGFPAEVLSSFARRDAIFLAPGFGPQSAETVAYVTTHELGHVLCWSAIDGHESRWDAYRERRGLAAGDGGPDAPHAQRHREIIAEDFRFLFGGNLATRSGTIENSQIPLPTTVPGLAELLAGFLAQPGLAMPALQPSRVYPNPCHDLATVEMSLPDGPAKSVDGNAVLEIFDVRGHLVQRLLGGRVSAGRVSVAWDGMSLAGGRAAAGIYLYRLTQGTSVGSGRLLYLSR